MAHPVASFPLLHAYYCSDKAFILRGIVRTNAAGFNKCTARRTPSKGLEPDVELDGVGPVVVEGPAALDLKGDGSAGLLVEQKKIHPVIVSYRREWREPATGGLEYGGRYQAFAVGADLGGGAFR